MRPHPQRAAVEDGVAMHVAGTAYGKHFPRRESLAAAGGRADTQ